MEQHGLPGVPQLWIGAAHVRTGEHVQIVEVVLIADLAREFVDHLRVADVLLLRGHREQQVVLHQPGHQAGLVARQALLQAESLGVHGAELGMIAATALGQVVEQRAEIDDLLLRELLHDRGDQRQFLVEFRYGKAPRVTDDEQRVRIDGVGVEQIVLHASDHAAESRNVAAQYAVVVHAAQLVGDAARCAQDLEKQPVVARILAKLLVDQPQVPSDRANGAGAHSTQLGVLLQQREQFEERGGLAREQVLADRLERAVAYLELRRQGFRGRIVAEDRLAEQLQ